MCKNRRTRKINNDLIKKFYDIKEQLKSCFKNFVTQVIKDNYLAEELTIYSTEVQTDINEISILVVFEFSEGNVDKITFYIDSKTSENIERVLREQIEEYLNDIIEDEDYD